MRKHEYYALHVHVLDMFLNCKLVTTIVRESVTASLFAPQVFLWEMCLDRFNLRLSEHMIDVSGDVV